MAAEGKDQVCLSPEQVSGWKPGKGVPSPFHALISGADRKPSRGKALLHRFPRRPQEGQKRTWKEDTESCDYVRVSVRCVPGCALLDSLGSMGLLGEAGLHFLSDQWQLSSVDLHTFFPWCP